LKRLGILGGTFDPIHLGHLRTAVEIGQEMDLEKVYLVPSASPPHKTVEPVTPFQHRLAMARLALGDSSFLEVLDLEGKRPGLSYSIETLKEIHNIFSPDPELYFILGVDAFQEIRTWKEYRHLFDYSHFVIIRRPVSQPDKIDFLLTNTGLDIRKTKRPDVFTAPSGKTLTFMSPTRMDISSTGIRKSIRNGKSIRFLVPDQVRNYIITKGLYRSNASS
jgi:nicotinate-nucleotide adenylyltransferase